MAKAVSLWLEFLEIAIHNVLYHRNIYPKKIFELKRKYNTPVHVITHNGLNQYITNVLKAATFLSQRDQLEQVHLQILDDENNPLQNYVFSLIKLQNEPLSVQSEDPFLLQMESVLQACLLRLSVAGSEMTALPENSCFELVLKLKDSYFVSNVKDDENFQKFQWIGQEKKQPQKDSKIVPIDIIQSELVQMELYIEDSSCCR